MRQFILFFLLNNFTISISNIWHIDTYIFPYQTFSILFYTFPLHPIIPYQSWIVSFAMILAWHLIRYVICQTPCVFEIISIISYIPSFPCKIWKNERTDWIFQMTEGFGWVGKVRGGRVSQKFSYHNCVLFPAAPISYLELAIYWEQEKFVFWQIFLRN